MCACLLPWMLLVVLTTNTQTNTRAILILKKKLGNSHLVGGEHGRWDRHALFFTKVKETRKKNVIASLGDEKTSKMAEVLKCLYCGLTNTGNRCANGHGNRDRNVNGSGKNSIRSTHLLICQPGCPPLRQWVQIVSKRVCGRRKKWPWAIGGGLILCPLLTSVFQLPLLVQNYLGRFASRTVTVLCAPCLFLSCACCRVSYP